LKSVWKELGSTESAIGSGISHDFLDSTKTVYVILAAVSTAALNYLLQLGNIYKSLKSAGAF
jgi:hypothetical protein